MTFSSTIRLGALALMLGALSSCSMLGLGGEAEKKPEAKSKDSSGGYADYAASGGGEQVANYNVSTPEDLARIDNGAQGEVFFTDPDNPEADIQGITDAFENKRTGPRWLRNFAQATRESRMQGLPLLLWFHNSVLSRHSKLVARELMETPEFLEWSEGKFVGLCMDAGKGLNDSSAMGQAATNYHSVERMRTSYGLKDYPSFVVMSANGQPILMIDGYDGYLASLSKRLKQGVSDADKAYDAYKKDLKKKGFREWRSRDGSRTLFAKLTRFDQKRDILYIKDAAGKQYKVHESKFHDDDVDYVENNLRDGGPKY